MGSGSSFPRVPLSKDRIIIVTGASTGLGYEIAKWCAMMGATVIMACRSEQRTKQAIDRMNDEFKTEKAKGTSGITQSDTLALEYMHVELSSFKSVVSFTEEFRNSGRKLHVLFLNAGFGYSPYSQTDDGYESVLQVNYLSHFLMTAKLLPIMQQSGEDCRILLMSSLAHRTATFDLSTINYAGPPGDFPKNEYYCRSKLYQVMQMFSMVKRLKSTNISVNSINPGFVSTNFASESSGCWSCMIPMFRCCIGRNSEGGSKSGINCATNPKLAGVTGEYFDRDCKAETPAATSRNETFQEQLWEETFKFLKDYITAQDRAVMEGKALSEMSEKIYEVDLQEVVEKYVYKRFKEDMCCLNWLFFREDKHYIDIRWGFVDFKETMTSTDRPLPLTVREKDLDLYKSEHENDTSSEQTYTFRTCRETTASTHIHIQNSYTIGGKINLEMNLCGLAKFGGGISGRKSSTSTKEEQHSEKQTWNIDTLISVPNWSRATATLELKEITRVTDFQVKTIVSLPKGKLPVSIRKIAGNEVVKTYWITNISKIFEPSYLETSKEIVAILKEQIEGTNQIDIKLQLTTQGVCKSVSGKEQRVKVELKKLTSETEVQTHTGSTGALSPDEPDNLVDVGDDEERKGASENETDATVIDGK